MTQAARVMRGPSLWVQGQSSRSSLLALDRETVQRSDFCLSLQKCI